MVATSASSAVSVSSTKNRPSSVIVTATYCCSSGADSLTWGSVTWTPRCTLNELVRRKKISSSSTMSVRLARLNSTTGLRPVEKSSGMALRKGEREKGREGEGGVSHSPPLSHSPFSASGHLEEVDEVGRGPLEVVDGAVDPVRQEVVHEQGRDADDEAGRRRDEGLPDAAREDGGVRGAPVALHGLERLDEAGDGAEEAEHGREGRRARDEVGPLLEVVRLPAPLRLDGLLDVGDGPADPLQPV